MMPEVRARAQRRSILSAQTARALLSDAASREALDRLTRRASAELRTPVALVGYAEADRLQVVSQVGLPSHWTEAGDVPLEATFCQYVQTSSDVLVVDDSARHPLARALPPLEGFPRGAYCGAPVRVNGSTVAILAVLDEVPRRWAPEDVSTMRELSSALVRDLEQLVPKPVAEREVRPMLSLETLPDGLLVLDRRWRFTIANTQALRLVERERESLLGKPFWEVFPCLVGSAFHHEFLRVVSDRIPIELEDYWPSLNRWLELRATPTADGGATIQLRDVSARRSAQEELRGREARYRSLFEESHTALFVMTPDSQLTEVNQACARLLGRERQELLGTPLAALVADAALFESVLHELSGQGSIEVELQLQRPAGVVPCLLSARAQVTGSAVTYHGALRDITTLKQTQEELVRSALHDGLTGLPNRVVFMDRLERLLRHAKRREDYRFAVLFLDLDMFKTMNDTHGHRAGDQLLVCVARRLEACVRQEDTVARIGGDEFGILLDTIHDVSDVTHVVDRIRESLAKSFADVRGASGLTVSIGVALSMTGYEQAEELLHDADAAMYRAKQTGRNAYVMFDADMQARALQQRRLESELRAAVAADQLVLYYHPVIELERGAVTGLEALIRWSHPERGMLLPSEFMPLAEQSGAVIELGWWVLGESCRQLRAWQLEFPEAAFHLTMSVNVSAKQFSHPGLVTKLDEILHETELDPQCLRLDLTEAVMMHDTQVTGQLVRELRARGVQISIDNFGTGFTSLSQLRELQISALKIDRSFIQRLGTNGEGREIVRTMLALGRSMSIDAVAEGVETPEQLEQLRGLGLRYAQGFLFSLPLDAAGMARLLSAGNG